MHKQLAALAAVLFVVIAAAPAAAQGRLFATDYGPGGQPPGPVRPYGGNAPEGEGADIVELDPATGAELNRFAAPLGIFWGPEGLAFDGSSLWFLQGYEEFGEGDNPSLFRLDPDTGVVQQSWVITSGFSFDGLGALDGLVYLLAYVDGEIHVFDPQAGTVVQEIDLFAANPAFEGSFVGGLSGFADEGVLLVTSQTFTGDPEAGEGIPGDLLFEIHKLNPATGAIVDTFPAGLDFNAGLAVANGQIFAGRLDSTELLVHSADGTLVDTFVLPYTISALGGDGAAAPGPGPSVLEIPTASGAGLAALAALLAGAGALSLRRRAAS
jgi:outer membrane protein assembly factor BamB